MYYIQQASVKISNKRYIRNQHDMEIILKSDTQVSYFDYFYWKNKNFLFFFPVKGWYFLFFLLIFSLCKLIFQCL